MKTKSITTLVDDALAHVEALLDATNGDTSRCHALDALHVEPLNDEQRRHLRSYISSWVEPSLRAARILLDEPTSVPYSLTDYASIVERSGDRSRFSGELAAAQSAGSSARLNEFVREVF